MVSWPQIFCLTQKPSSLPACVVHVLPDQLCSKKAKKKSRWSSKENDCNVLSSAVVSLYGGDEMK